MKPTWMLILAVCTIAVLGGCGVKPIPVVSTPDNDPAKVQTPPPKTEPVMPSPENVPANELMAEWQKMAEGDYKFYDTNRAVEIGNKMAEAGASGLDPFFAVIKDPAAKPAAKMLAVISLASHINDSHVPQLLPLTDPAYDEATRGCAVHLLSRSFGSDAFFRVLELMKDESKHVSKVATLAMLRKGVGEALEPALAIWDNPDTLDRDRDEIVLAIPDAMAVGNQRIFREAIHDSGITPLARSRAVELLGHVATAEAIPDLKACLESETDPSIRDMIASAIAAIEKRAEEGVTAVPVPVTEGMNVVFEPHAVEEQPASPAEQ